MTSANSSLRITISGPPGSGKTTLSILICDALMLAGFDVKNNDPDCESGKGILCAKDATSRLGQVAYKSTTNGPIVVETETEKYVSRTKTIPLRLYMI